MTRFRVTTHVSHFAIVVVFLFFLPSCKIRSVESLFSEDKPSPSYSVYRSGNRYKHSHNDHFLDVIQPIFSKRCVTCHFCTVGPCQINLTDFEMIRRGGHPHNPYKLGVGTRRVEPTRPEDQLSVLQWRELGFYDILSTKNTDSSLLLESVTEGLNNSPQNPHFSEETARQRALDQKNTVCPTNTESYETFTRAKPIRGMPWGLPSLTQEDTTILRKWTLMGSPGPKSSEDSRLDSEPLSDSILAWERFLNGDSRDFKRQYVAKYIFEHTFLARYHFEEVPGEFYSLVRSSTPPGQKIQKINTEVVTDAPPAEVERVYYRFVKEQGVVELATHALFRVNTAKLEVLGEVFFKTDWNVDSPPLYSHNPFEWFHKIPVEARAWFMREHTRMLYQSYARGPICFTRTATYGGADNFVTFWLKPEVDPTVQVPDLGLGNYEYFYRKSHSLELKEIENVVTNWGVHRYKAAFEKTLRDVLGARDQNKGGLSLDDIWMGGPNKNPNAWTHSLRHDTSTQFFTSKRSTLPGRPQSAWVLTYANFERIFYNAAVHFKYFGSLLHQMQTFHWQSTVRTESEDLFISLLRDPKMRMKVRGNYTSKFTSPFLKLNRYYPQGRTAHIPIEWRKREHLFDDGELMKELHKRMGPEITGEKDRLNNWPEDDLPQKIVPGKNSQEQFESGLRTLTGRPGGFVRHLPQVSHLIFVEEGKRKLYTLIVDRAHKEHKFVVTGNLSLSRLPHLDTLKVVPGLMGAFSYLILIVDHKRAGDFLQGVAKVSKPKHWQELAKQFKVSRNAPQIWDEFDWLNRWQAENLGAEAGILSLRHYDSPESFH